MHEIIHVVDPRSLAGTLRQGLEIEAVNDHPLAAGYYFVLWPARTRPSDNREKRYFGPFPTRAEARLLQRSALALGIVEDEKVIQTVAECRSIVRRPAAAIGSGAPRNYSQWRQQPAACAA
ncbi:MAG: hypothetical protein A2045_13875 [Rhodocyclales bacterium GWA2_65_20]|nr:MAG: hypothetical protein A2045_13875 [Rhodocyclales bacterium GWA2_65_20]